MIILILIVYFIMTGTFNVLWCAQLGEVNYLVNYSPKRESLVSTIVQSPTLPYHFEKTDHSILKGGTLRMFYYCVKFPFYIKFVAVNL